jgi:hypothetical protein
MHHPAYAGPRLKPVDEKHYVPKLSLLELTNALTVRLMFRQAFGAPSWNSAAERQGQGGGSSGF